MRFNTAQTHRFHHHRKGKRIGTNVSFEQNSKVHFTAVRYNISEGESIVKVCVIQPKYSFEEKDIKQ